jgi:hypothetical protein
MPTFPLNWDTGVVPAAGHDVPLAWERHGAEGDRNSRTAAVLFSLTPTCRRLGVEPWAYLQDVLTRLPATPAHDLLGLLPDPWQAAQAVTAATKAAAVPAAPA